ncbi:hypothetical protein VYU27_003097 [Nannochloropsis oceanica]
MFEGSTGRHPVQPIFEAEKLSAAAVTTSRRRVSSSSRWLPPSQLQRRAERRAAQAQEVTDRFKVLFASVSARALSLPSHRHDLVTWVWLWVTCGLIMASYWTTLGEVIAGGDSGKLVAEACRLDTLRLTQYPLLTLLQRLVILCLPVAGSPSWKANIISAICTTMAAGCLFLCIVVFGQARHRCYHPSMSSSNDSLATATSTTTLVAAAAGAGLFAWSPLVWRYAVSAEVFALNNALLALLLYTTLRFASSWTSQDRRFWACTTTLLCGLALANQHTAILVEVPVVFYLAWCLRRDLARQPSGIIIELGRWFILGLFPLVYALLSVLWRPQIGRLGNMITWQEIWSQLRQGEFPDLQPASDPDDVTYRESAYCSQGAYAWDLILRQGQWGLVPLLALLGYVAATVFTAPFLLPPRYRGERAKVTRATDGYIQQILTNVPAPQPPCTHTKDARSQGPYHKAEAKARQESHHVIWALGGAWVLSLFAFDFFSPEPLNESVELSYNMMARFWMQANLLVFMLAGVGMDWLSCVVARGQWQVGRQQDSRFSFNLTASLAQAVCVVLALWQFQQHFAMSGQYANTYSEKYARSLLAPLPPDSLLLVNHKLQWNSLRYMQSCKNYRLDVTILKLSLMSLPWWPSLGSHHSGKVIFPGTHHVPENHCLARGGQAFAMHQFVDANIDRVGGIFVAGNLTFSQTEEQLRSVFTMLPMGLNMQLFRREDVWTMKEWLKRIFETWHLLQQHSQNLLSLAELPALDKYQRGKWEYEIRRDYLDHLAETAAHALDEAIGHQNLYNRSAGGGNDDMTHSPTTTKMSSTLVLKHFLDAAWWLEVLVAHDPEHTTHTLNNLGLAYYHLLYLSPTVSLATAEAQLRRVPRVSPFNDASLATTASQWYRGPGRQETDWRMWLLNRLEYTWGTCLTRPDAQQLPEVGKLQQQHKMIVARMRPLLEKKENLASRKFRGADDP